MLLLCGQPALFFSEFGSFQFAVVPEINNAAFSSSIFRINVLIHGANFFSVYVSSLPGPQVHTAIQPQSRINVHLSAAVFSLSNAAIQSTAASRGNLSTSPVTSSQAILQSETVEMSQINIALMGTGHVRAVVAPQRNAHRNFISTVNTTVDNPLEMNAQGAATHITSSPTAVSERSSIIALLRERLEREEAAQQAELDQQIFGRGIVIGDLGSFRYSVSVNSDTVDRFVTIHGKVW